MNIQLNNTIFEAHTHRAPHPKKEIFVHECLLIVYLKYQRNVTSLHENVVYIQNKFYSFIKKNEIFRETDRLKSIILCKY